MIYTPREDSFLLEREVKKLAKNKAFLDIGAGSGIQAKAALSVRAKSVLAADINQEAITLLKKQGIHAIKSNLFSKIKGKFDMIAFNPPYLPEDKKEDRKSKLTTTGGKRGDEIILRFLKEVKKHLADNGIILLVISSLTPRKQILALLKKQSLKRRALSSKKFFFESLEVWKIKKSLGFV